MVSLNFTVFYILTSIIDVFLSITLFLMLVRVVLSWLPISDDNIIDEFVYTATEPFIIPVRILFDKFDIMNGLPIDIPFFVSYVILTFLQRLVSVIRG